MRVNVENEYDKDFDADYLIKDSSLEDLIYEGHAEVNSLEELQELVSKLDAEYGLTTISVINGQFHLAIHNGWID